MIRRLMFVIHQRHRLDSQRRGGSNLRVRVVTEGEIKAAVARPFTQGPRASNQIAGFARYRSAAMTANYVREQARLHGQRDRLGKVARGDLDLMTTLSKFGNQRMKERHVRRVREIDPDAHRRLQQVSWPRIYADESR